MGFINSQSKFLNRMFRKVDGVVWDLSSNTLGLQNSNGIYTLTRNTVTREGGSEETVFGISVNPFDAFGFPIPAFAQITKLGDIAVGDLVVGDKGALGWVTQVRDRSLQLLDQNGMTKNYTPPKLAVLNQDGALVVKSLTGLFGEQGAANFSSALMPLLLAGDSLGSSLEEILPLLLLTQQQAGGNGNVLASALPTILMAKTLGRGNSKVEDLLLPMILAGSQGNNGGFNPMLLLALGGGLNTSSQFIAGGVPALQARPVPPLTVTRRG